MHSNDIEPHSESKQPTERLQCFLAVLSLNQFRHLFKICLLFSVKYIIVGCVHVSSFKLLVDGNRKQIDVLFSSLFFIFDDKLFGRDTELFSGCLLSTWPSSVRWTVCRIFFLSFNCFFEVIFYSVYVQWSLPG